MLTKLAEAAEQSLGFKLDRDRFILAGNAFDKFSFFLYRPGQPNPACIAKTARTARGTNRCAIEYDVISRLGNIDITCARFPKPLGIIDADSQTFYLQEYAIGELLLGQIPLYRKRFRREHFLTATRLLADLYFETKEAAAAENRSYSRCFQHRDFWIGNIATADSGLILYDLEFSEISGLPLYDLLHFGIYYFRVLSNIGSYRLHGRSGAGGAGSVDDRVIELQGADVKTVFGSRNRFSKRMYQSIFDYTDKCFISDDDALELVLSFIGNDRDVVNLGEQWKSETISTFEYWRQECNAT